MMLPFTLSHLAFFMTCLVAVGFMIRAFASPSGAGSGGGDPLYEPVDPDQLPGVWKGQRILSPRFIREAQRRNIPVQVWVVDDPDEMRRFLAWGVDGIQTDRPDLLASVLTEVAGRAPPPSKSRAEASA